MIKVWPWSHEFSSFFDDFSVFLYLNTNKAKHGQTIDQKWKFHWDINWFSFRVEFPKKEIDYIVSGSIKSVALVSGFLNVVVWQYLMLISQRYSPINSQGWFRVNQLCSLAQRLSKCGYMIVFGADFIEISTKWFSGSNFSKEIDNVMCTLGSIGGFPKMGIAHGSLVILGNVCSLLVMMGRKKLQYLPYLRLNIVVALFLEHIPYMYIYAPIWCVRM